MYLYIFVPLHTLGLKGNRGHLPQSYTSRHTHYISEPQMLKLSIYLFKRLSLFSLTRLCS